MRWRRPAVRHTHLDVAASPAVGCPTSASLSVPNGPVLDLGCGEGRGGEARLSARKARSDLS